MGDKWTDRLHAWERKPLVQALTLWCVALLVLVPCSFNTSPLNPFLGGDAHFFRLMGRMTAEGALPFADVYDQKGPLVFYIHALGWLISPGKSGILLLQSTALASSLFLVYRLCRLWGDAVHSLAALGVFVAVYAACLWGGDMTEEYSLPLCLLPSYLVLRGLAQGEGPGKLSLRTAFGAGICLGLLAFLRLNNAAPLCGVLLSLAAMVRSRKDFLHLLRYAGCSLFGLLVASAPFILYFAARGALEDMLTGTFIHNFHYATQHTAEKTALDTLGAAAKASSLLLLALLLWKKGHSLVRTRGAAAGLTGFCAFSTLVPTCGPASSHYFIIAAPAIALTFVLYAGRLDAPWKTWSLAALLLLPFTVDAAHLAAGFRRYNLVRDYAAEIEAARHLATLIPDAGKNSVWACDVHASIYTYGELTPCCRYFTMQGEMGRFNPKISPAIRQMMQEDPPRHLIVPLGGRCSQAPVNRALRDGTYTLRYRDSDTLHIELWEKAVP